MTSSCEIFRAFSQSAARYESAAVMQQETAHRLLDRMAYLAIKPERILDIGCGTGALLQPLKLLFPAAQVWGLDAAWGMLTQAQHRALPVIQADMMHLPLPSESIDLVVANQVLHWSSEPAACFKEIHRVLKPGGCLFFSTLGPDTFQELRQAWAQVDTYSHVASFWDMHTLGDMLLAQQFSDPVMDREDLKLEYPSLRALLRHLKAQGVRHIDKHRRPGLTSRQAWKHFENAFKHLSPNAVFLRYELLYGHAWRTNASTTEFSIPLTQLRNP